MSDAFEHIEAGLADTLAYAEGDTRAGRRRAVRGDRRKPYAVEFCFPNSRIFRGWAVFKRYPTRDRRDRALAALVKKAERERFGVARYRARDD